MRWGKEAAAYFTTIATLCLKPALVTRSFRDSHASAQLVQYLRMMYSGEGRCRASYGIGHHARRVRAGPARECAAEVSRQNKEDSSVKIE